MKRYSIVEHHSSKSDNMWFEIEKSEGGPYVKYDGLEGEIKSAILAEAPIGDIEYGVVCEALRKVFRNDDNRINKTSPKS